MVCQSSKIKFAVNRQSVVKCFSDVQFSLECKSEDLILTTLTRKFGLRPNEREAPRGFPAHYLPSPPLHYEMLNTNGGMKVILINVMSREKLGIGL